jgi:hypothetical protein
VDAAENHQESTKFLGALVREALAEVDNNVEKAISRLLYQIRNDKQLLQQIIESAVHDAVQYRLQRSINHQRGAIVRHIEQQKMNAAIVDRGRDKGRVSALAAVISSALLDTPLRGGKLLRYADRHEVLAQIEAYEKNAQTMSHRARWLRLVLQSVPDGKYVGQVVSEKRALELFEAASEQENAA